MAVAHAESFAGGASPCAPYRLPGLPARAGRSVRSPPSAAKPRHHNIVHGMPSLAPRRWRGGAMGTSRPTATGHEGGAPRCRPGGAHGHGARAMSVRKMRDAKPRTAPRCGGASRGGWGAPTGGCGQASRRIAPWSCVMRVRTARASFACVMAVGRDVPIAPHRPVAVRILHDAKPRTAPMARRREPGGPAAKHRALPQLGTRGAHHDAARAVRTVTGHGRCAARAPGKCAPPAAGVMSMRTARANFACVMAVGREPRWLTAFVALVERLTERCYNHAHAILDRGGNRGKVFIPLTETKDNQHEGN